MATTKEQLLHLDLPKVFRENPVDSIPNELSSLSWDLALLGLTIFWLLDHYKE